MDEKNDEQESKLAKQGESERNGGQDVLSRVRKGAKWGMIVGFVFAQTIISSNSPLGFYLGNMGLVYLTCIGGGTAIGALFSWLYTMMPDEEER